MLNHRKMSMGIIKKGKKYLLLKRSFHCKSYWNTWQFPGGGIDFKETPLQSLKRELKEELDLKLKIAKKIGIYKSKIIYFRITLWYFTRFVFNCKVSGKIKLSNKHSKYGWFTKKEIKKLKLMKSLEYNKIKKYL